jgi:hypothetical protein
MDQEGIVGGGVGYLIEANEIAWCNYQGNVDPYWEAGGSKFWASDSVTIRNNYVHDNIGPGLWCDNFNTNIVYEGNICLNDTKGPGLFQEISGSAIMRCNILRGNSDPRQWMWDGQLLIAASNHVEVYWNTIEVPNDGQSDAVSLIQQNRTDGGVFHSLRDNYIHDNDVTFKGSSGLMGGVADYDATNVFNNNNNVFMKNHYHVPVSSQAHWSWNGTKNFSQWQALGFDTNGTIDNNISRTSSYYCPECKEVLLKNPFIDKGIVGGITVRSKLPLHAATAPENRNVTVRNVPGKEIELAFAQKYSIASIIDLKGRMVRTIQVTGLSACSVARKGLAAGIYLVALRGPASASDLKICVQ